MMQGTPGTVYLHSSKESMYDKGVSLGLTDEALNNFKYACYEVQIVLNIDPKTGDAQIVECDGRQLVDVRDLKNMMRHMFLIGWNCGARREAAELGDFQEDEREETINEMLVDFVNDGYHCGYGDMPCSCQKSHGLTPRNEDEQDSGCSECGGLIHPEYPCDCVDEPEVIPELLATLEKRDERIAPKKRDEHGNT